MKEENQERGKKARRDGARFELKVRENLEKDGWTVDKWTNNVDLDANVMHAARSNRFNMRTTGFPDFITFRRVGDGSFIVAGVEVKSRGYLNASEKAKVEFYQKNNTFGQFFIAKKGEDRQIVWKRLW